MDFLNNLFTDVVFRLSILSRLDLIDLGLVTAAYYGVLQLVRRSQAAFLLRILLMAVFVLLATNLLLPLPTFDTVVAIAIVVLLVAAPIAMQSEIQAWLQRFGRNQFRRTNSPEVAEMVATPVRRAMNQMSESKTGALLAIEGRESLDHIIKTGIPVNARLTDELLRTLFYDKSPLHDGAVILRDTEVVAAGCVLPLTEQELISQRRLGTRHRAAVGLSEVSDALVLVVSEETGRMARAQAGNLKTALDEAGVQGAIVDFYTNEAAQAEVKQLSTTEYLRRVGSSIVYFMLAFFFAALTWAVVVQRTNPIVSAEISNVPLRVTDLPDAMLLQSNPPETVSLQVRSTQSIINAIAADSFVANASLANLESGLQRVDLVLDSSLDPAQTPLASTTILPSALDVELVPIVTQPMPVGVVVNGTDQLPLGYAVDGPASAFPTEITVTGSDLDVARVVSLQASVSVANVTAPINRRITLQPIDAAGEVVDGITLEQPTAQVVVLIRQEFSTETVSVRIDTDGDVPDSYTLRGTTVTPGVVTLRGDTDEMQAFNAIVSTAPVDISQSRGTLTVDVPLVLPEGIVAIDAQGEPILTVQVTADIAPLQSEIALEKAVTLPAATDTLTVTIEPASIQMLLSGPLPTLDRIVADPDLVAIRIDISDVPVGVPTEVEPVVIAPENVTVQLVTPTVIVLIEEPVEPSEPVEETP